MRGEDAEASLWVIKRHSSFDRYDCPTFAASPKPQLVPMAPPLRVRNGCLELLFVGPVFGQLGRERGHASNCDRSENSQVFREHGHGAPKHPVQC